MAIQKPRRVVFALLDAENEPQHRRSLELHRAMAVACTSRVRSIALFGRDGYLRRRYPAGSAVRATDTRLALSSVIGMPKSQLSQKTTSVTVAIDRPMEMATLSSKSTSRMRKTRKLHTKPGKKRMNRTPKITSMTASILDLGLWVRYRVGRWTRWPYVSLFAHPPESHQGDHSFERLHVIIIELPHYCQHAEIEDEQAGIQQWQNARRKRRI